MVECSKFYCKSCSFQNLQNASRGTTSVSNRTSLLHKSQLPFFVMILKTLRPNTVHLIAGQSVYDSYSISRVHIYCDIRGGRVVRWCWVNFQCRGVLQLGYSRARAYCARSRCGWGLFGHFYSPLFFLSSFSLSLGDGSI